MGENTEPTPPGIQSVKYVRDVFITHCEANRGMAKAIFEALKSKNLECGWASQDFIGGNFIMYQIIEAIGTSKKILAIISKDSQESYWCTFELALTIERTTTDGRVAIIPVVLDMEKNDIDLVLQQFQCIHVDGGNLTDQKIAAICDVLKGPDVSIGNLLPVGNIGRGLAWSYYTSFLNIVLKDIQIAMDAYANDNDLSISRKVYLLLPMSCSCPAKLTDKDAKVEETGTDHRNSLLRPKPIEITRAGKPRKYNNTVYKIRKNNKVYHFVAECCSIVKSMLPMEEGQIAHLTAEEKHRQVLVFYLTLKDILNHNYPGRCRIIRVNDKEIDGPKLSDLLLDHLEKDLRQTARPLERGVQDLSIDGQQGDQKSEEGLQTVDSSMNLLNSKSEKGADFYDVFIVSGDGKNDRKLAKEIADFLETNGKTCKTNHRDLVPGGVTLTDMGAFTKRSQKTIMILSDETTDKELSICCMLRPPSEHDQLSKAVLPIPVLRELKEKNKEIEDFTKTMTYIETTQADFWDGLLKAVNADLGQRPPLPAGEIAPGFAWNYFYGYMTVLSGLKECPELSSNDNIRGRVSHKRFLFMPKSGTMFEKLDQIPGVEKYDPGHIKKKEDVAGNCNRDYDCFMYKVKSLETKEDWYFVGEYITPLVVLKDMKDGLVAGLSTKAYADQVAGLYSRLENILSQEHAQEHKGKWRLFQYDDQEPDWLARLSNDILQAVQEDVAEQGVQEDVAGQGVQEDVAGQGVQEDVAEQGVQEDVAGQGVQEDVAGQGVQEDVTEQGQAPARE